MLDQDLVQGEELVLFCDLVGWRLAGCTSKKNKSLNILSKIILLLQILAYYIVVLVL